VPTPLVLLLFALGAPVAQAARSSPPEQTPVCFDETIARPTDVPATIAARLEEAGEGPHLVVRLELNDDDVPDYLLPTLCGTGGCVWLVFDGATGRPFGELSGRPLCTTAASAPGLPAFESFWHLSAGSGLHQRFAFEDATYTRSSAVLLEGEAVTRLFEQLDRLPRLTPAPAP
jgi:hypothetical protein